MSIVPSFQLAGIAAAVAFALGASSAWKVTSWRYEAQEAATLRDFAETQRQERAREAAKQRQFEARQAQLLADRSFAQTEIERLRQIKPETLIQDVEVARDDAPHVCPDPRIGPDFVRLYNDQTAAANRVLAPPAR